MFCKKCGKEIMENTDFCPYCGTKTTQNTTETQAQQYQPKSNGIAIAGFICSFFIPLLGWIFGGVGLHRSKERNGVGKGFSISAIVIATVIFFISFVRILNSNY